MNIEKIRSLASTIIEKHNLVLVNVLEVFENGLKIVRIIIDDEKTFYLDIDLVAEINQEILDEVNDLLDDDAYLELSSLGAERKLVNECDFKRAIDNYIYIKLKDKVKGLGDYLEFNGYLKDFYENCVLVEANLKGRIKSIEIDKNNIEIIRLAIKF